MYGFNIGKTILHNEKVDYSSLFLNKLMFLSKKHKKGSNKKLNTSDDFLRIFARDSSIVVYGKNIIFNTYNCLFSMVEILFL